MNLTAELHKIYNAIFVVYVVSGLKILTNKLKQFGIAVYLHVSLYYIIALRIFQERLEILVNWALLNVDNKYWKILWTTIMRNKYRLNLATVNPSYFIIKHKILWIFNRNIYKIGDSHIVNLLYIKHIMYLLTSNSRDQLIYDEKRVSQIPNHFVTFIYALEDGIHHLTIDFKNYMYLKDVDPIEIYNINTQWKKILFNRIQL